jgi:hypothetical protein
MYSVKVIVNNELVHSEIIAWKGRLKEVYDKLTKSKFKGSSVIYKQVDDANRLPVWVQDASKTARGIDISMFMLQMRGTHLHEDVVHSSNS